MSTVSTTTSHRLDLLHPLLAATIGAAAFATAMTAGEAFGLAAEPDGGAATTWQDIAGYLGLVVVAVLVATWLGQRARAGSPRRLAGTALGLAIGAAVTFVAFWSGWPQVFGAVAVALAVEHRRRVGSFSATALFALVLGATALVAATITCVLG